MKDKKPPRDHFRIADWMKSPPDFSKLPKKSPASKNSTGDPPQLDPGWFEVHQFGLENPSAVVRVDDENPGRKEYWDFAPTNLDEKYHWPNEDDTEGVPMTVIAISESAYNAILQGWDSNHPKWIFTGFQVN